MSDVMAQLDGRLFTRFSCGLQLFDTGWSFNLFGLFIPVRLPYRDIDDGQLMESWGFSLCDRSIHFNWGPHTKIIRFPWDWEHLKHEVRRPDGSWVPFVGSWEKGKDPDGRWTGTYQYEYRLKSGEVQHRLATVHVERREWRWRWMMWSPWPAIKRQCIDVQFDDEVGERTGSWKGGTVGCGYEMLPHEAPRDTLMRMEKERKFE